MAGEIQDNRGRGDAGWQWPSIHSEGRKFGLISGAVALTTLVLLGWDFLGWLLVMLTVGVFAFFRDPERVVPHDDRLVLSPADGQVTLIEQVEPPRELVGDDANGQSGLSPGVVTRVSIFMSVFDVHINRAPISGVVKRLIYIPGKFMNADLDKASDENERQHLLVERGDGLLIGFTQIAGLVARRIVPFVKTGDIIAAGQRVGLIRFGSRVDIYLPDGTGSKVLLGQKVVAGETVIAELGAQTMLEGVAQ